MKIGTIFSGFDGVGVGARATGLEHAWGIEYDDDLAQVARDNGFHVITADAIGYPFHALERVDVLHASPPCITASVANVGTDESQMDLDIALAVEDAILQLRPTIFTLENVWGYRNYQSFANIVERLTSLDYAVDWWHLNFADYGVPQTRKRLILVARRDGKRVVKPTPTHHQPEEESPQTALFPPSTEPWVGWYAALADIIHTLPDSKLANWQRRRLEKQGAICDGGLLVSGLLNNQRDLKAVLVPGGNGSNDVVRVGACPAPTLDAPAGKRTRPMRALTETRVVRLTPRAFARLQTFPDDYRLPEKASLAVRGLGNAVPPLGYQRIIEAQQ